MTLYEWLSIAIAIIALGVTIWAHRRVNKINAKIQYIQKLSTSGEQSLVITTSGGQSLVISGSNVSIIYNYATPDNKAP